MYNYSLELVTTGFLGQRCYTEAGLGLALQQVNSEMIHIELCTCCVALPCCLFDLASFFLSSFLLHLSNMHTNTLPPLTRVEVGSEEVVESADVL